jgi:hypothetical protein
MIIDEYIETIGRYILQQRNARKPARVPALKVFEWAQLLRLVIPVSFIVPPLRAAIGRRRH